MSDAVAAATTPDRPRYVLITPTGYHDQLDLMARFHTLFGIDRLSWAGDAMLMTEDQARQLLAAEFPSPAPPSPPPAQPQAPPVVRAAVNQPPAPAAPRRTDRKKS